MIIDLNFNPTKLDVTEEAWLAFNCKHRVVTNFWALFKMHHLTNQHFVPALEEFNLRMDNFIEEGEVLYHGPRGFKHILIDCGFTSCNMIPPPSNKWIIKYWDYLNLNIQKKITFKYKCMEEVTKVI